MNLPAVCVTLHVSISNVLVYIYAWPAEVTVLNKNKWEWENVCFAFLGLIFSVASEKIKQSLLYLILCLTPVNVFCLTSLWLCAGESKKWPIWEHNNLGNWASALYQADYFSNYRHKKIVARKVGNYHCVRLRVRKVRYAWYFCWTRKNLIYILWIKILLGKLENYIYMLQLHLCVCVALLYRHATSQVESTWSFRRKHHFCSTCWWVWWFCWLTSLKTV